VFLDQYDIVNVRFLNEMEMAWSKLCNICCCCCCCRF